MVRTICKSFTQWLARIIPVLKANANKSVTASAVHRRIEVTVERESVAMRVRGPSAGRAKGVDADNESHERGLASRSGSKEEEPTT